MAKYRIVKVVIDNSNIRAPWIRYRVDKKVLGIFWISAVGAGEYGADGSSCFDSYDRAKEVIDTLMHYYYKITEETVYER